MFFVFNYIKVYYFSLYVVYMRKSLLWEKFWRLTVLWDWRTTDSWNRYLICRCECWNTKEIAYSSLTTWASKSCWCLRKEMSIDRFTTHWWRKSRIYNIRSLMKARCNNKNNPAFKNYWWRWISICNKWNNSFYEFMIRSDKNWYSKDMQIDRIDNNLGYAPENCRRTNRTIQARNKRNNIIIERDWEKKTLSERIEYLWINQSTVENRIYWLWRTYEKALFTKIWNNWPNIK